jgi:hypothetical protein
MMANTVHSCEGAVFQNTEGDVSARAAHKFRVFGVFMNAVAMPLDAVGDNVGSTAMEKLHKSNHKNWCLVPVNTQD